MSRINRFTQRKLSMESLESRNFMTGIPSRTDLIRALRSKRDHIVALNQERQELIDRIRQDHERLENQQSAIDQLKSQHEQVVAHPVTFPRVQRVEQHKPFVTAVIMGIGFIVAPFVLLVIILLIIFFLVTSGVGIGAAFR